MTEKVETREMLIALYDTNRANTKLLRDELDAYAIRENTDFRLLTLSGRDTLPLVEKYAPAIGLALISLDEACGREFGCRLATFNPCCYLCYYTVKDKPDLYPLLRSRPYEVFFQIKDRDCLHRRLDAALADYLQASGVFVHETRKTLLCYPVSSLLYFQSDLKYVSIHSVPVYELNTAKRLDVGESAQIYAKLSGIEEELQKQRLLRFFARIHKSYLVNMLHVISLDKQSHSVRLDTGELLPISDAYYSSASERLNTFHGL